MLKKKNKFEIIHFYKNLSQIKKQMILFAPNYYQYIPISQLFPKKTKMIVGKKEKNTVGPGLLIQ